MIRQAWWGCCWLAVSSCAVALANDLPSGSGELFQTRTWTHRDGQQIEGRAVRWDHDSVVIECEGKRYEIALRDLDQDDRSIVIDEVMAEARRKAPPPSTNYSQGTPTPPPTNYGPQNYTPQVPSMPSYEYREQVITIPLPTVHDPIADIRRRAAENASRNAAYESARTGTTWISRSGLATLLGLLFGWIYRKMNS